MVSDSMYTYGAEGNIVLVDGGTTATDIFDALNRRVSHATSNLIQRYEYNASGQSSDVWNGEAQYKQTARYYANGQNFAYWTGAGNNPAAGTLHSQHGDYTGTVRARTNDTGSIEGTYFSLPFGDGYRANGTDDDASHFAQLDRDNDTGNHQATFRTYSTANGRWSSPDPYNGSYDPTMPQSFNRYAYVGNNPLTYIDPWGLDYGYDCGPSCVGVVATGGGSSGGGGGGGGGTGAAPLQNLGDEGGGGGGSGGGPDSNAPSNTAKRLACAAKYGQDHSIGAAFGGGKVASFLGGNAVSSLLNVGLAATGNGPSPNPVNTYLSGPALGIPVNDALRLAGRPGIQGIGSASGAVRGAGLTGIFNAATESGGIASIAGDGAEIAVQGGLEAGEFASGIGLAKFGFDAATVLYGYAFGCPK